MTVRMSRESIFRAGTFLLFAAIAMSFPVKAQKQEIGLTIGGLLNPDRAFHDPQGSVQSSLGISLGADYARRFWSSGNIALYGEVEFVANARSPNDLGGRSRPAILCHLVRRSWSAA